MLQFGMLVATYLGCEGVTDGVQDISVMAKHNQLPLSLQQVQNVVTAAQYGVSY